METKPHSYGESSSSSPPSRDSNLDSTNPPVPVTVPPSSSSWEEYPRPHPQPRVPPHHKVKFFVSYGGQIQPRHHDIHLSYVGGHTKILYVDRSISFSSLISKLSSLIDHSPTSLSSFKYQLPGEDLDALISVSNDDDLQHLMHEYDRLYRASPKPVRFRLFLFPPDHSSRFGSGSGDNNLDRYTEALNSAPATEKISDKVDFLFGLGSQDPMIQELNKLQISGPRSNARESHQKPTSYWPVAMERPQQQPVYVYQTPQQASVYHAPQPPTQRYYQVASAPVYYQDTTGRHVYYAAPGGVGVTTPFQGVPPVIVSAGFTTAGVDGKNIVSKIFPTSAAV